MPIGVGAWRTRAPNDPLPLGAALAIQPALLVLQTLLSVVVERAFPEVFAVGFLVADLAVMVALVRLARSERDRATSIGTAVLVGFVALSSLLSVVGQVSTSATLATAQGLVSSAAGPVSFVLALAVFAVIASIARAADAPFRLPATFVFAILTCVAIVAKVLHFTSGEGRTPMGAWLGLILELARAALPVALAVVTSRAITADAKTRAADGSPYRAAAIVEEPPVTLDVATLPAWRDALRGLRAIQIALFVRLGLGAAFALVFGVLVKSSAAERMPGAIAYVLPVASLVGAIVTMLGYLRARTIGTVGGARAGWLVSQTLWAFVVLLDVVTLMIGLNAALETTRGERLTVTLAFVAFPGAMTLLLELCAALWTARALRVAAEALRDPLLTRRAGVVLAVGLVAVGAFFASLGGSWRSLEIDSRDLGTSFVLALAAVALLLAGATLGLLGRLVGAVRETVARAIASAG